MKKQGQGPAFRSEASFVRATAAYLGYCSGENILSGTAAAETPSASATGAAAKAVKRIPNVAGFCRFSRITRSEFAALRAAYPRAYDIMESAFTDEALNNKMLNSGSVLGYLLTSVNRFGGEEGGGLEFEHDLDDDGG